MTDFTRTNFDDIEPMRGGEGPIDARFSRAALGGSDQLGVSRFRYEPDTALSFGHHHEEQEEVYVVVSGSGRMKLDEEVIDLQQWDVVHVPPAVMRGIHAGPDGIELVVAGGRRPPEGDGHMTQDFWT
jgi:mannose-6-phosphate isomerase-like protein (cupin superfamily)